MVETSRSAGTPAVFVARPMIDTPRLATELDDDAYYRSSRFNKCEWGCGASTSIYSIVCASCAIKISGMVPISERREPDFSGVRKILMELAS